MISEDGFHSEEFPKIYPAMFSIIKKMLEGSVTKEAQEQSVTYAKGILNELLYS